MSGYAKGANAERELIKLFFGKGFAVARIAGSGVSTLPSPDIIALKPGKLLAVECKAWAQKYLSIAVAQMKELEQWGKTAGTGVFIAWKLPHKGWFFLLPKHFKKKQQILHYFPKKSSKNRVADRDYYRGTGSHFPEKIVINTLPEQFFI